MNDTFAKTMELLREYNQLTKTPHYLKIYADSSGRVYSEKSVLTAFCICNFDNLEMLNAWLEKQIQDIYWPVRYEIGMRFVDEREKTFVVEFVNDTEAVVANAFGQLYRIEHGSKDVILQCGSVFGKTRLKRRIL
jgi:hypothetical protein